uniref:Ubiquitin-like protease family profile domain-containing protein n=1 Tax=Chenopodium quinoa TaxID=63459 RepID=A0A803N876_CHEQI
MITSLSENGIPVADAYRVIRDQAGGEANLSFLQRDLYVALSGEKKEFDGAGTKYRTYHSKRHQFVNKTRSDKQVEDGDIEGNQPIKIYKKNEKKKKSDKVAKIVEEAIVDPLISPEIEKESILEEENTKFGEELHGLEQSKDEPRITQLIDQQEGEHPSVGEAGKNVTKPEESNAITVLMREPKTEKKSQPTQGGDDASKKIKPYGFKQIASKKVSKKGGNKKGKAPVEVDDDEKEAEEKVFETTLVEAHESEKGLMDAHEKAKEKNKKKIVLKKRRAPMGEPYFEVREPPEKGVPQSISQAINESSIVVVPPKPVAIVKQSKAKRARREITRQTVQPLMILTKSLQEQEQQDKLQAIKDMGFGGFLDLDFPKGKPNFCAMLVQEFEENGMYIKCDRNRSLDITLMDVHLVYGIPYGGEDLVEAKLDDPMFKEVFEGFKRYHGGRIPTLGAICNKLSKVETPLTDDWKRSFLALAVNCCIKHITNPQPYFRFLNIAIDTSKIAHFNWCKYTIESLIEATTYWKGDAKRYLFPGPLPFLMVCYFDRLKKKLTFDEPRDFPLLKVWKGKKIRDRIKLELKSGIGLGIMLDRIKVPWTVENQNLLLKEPKQQEPSPKEQHQEEGFNQQHETKEQHQEHDKTNLNSPTNMQEYNQLLREATERIASGFVNLSNVLKLGEKFYTAPLVEKNAMYNVAAMWSKCSGYRIPQEIQPQTQFQRGEGSSILSQDNDFFGADWFGNMIDDVVMNVLKSNETIEDRQPINPQDQEPINTQDQEPINPQDQDQFLSTGIQSPSLTPLIFSQELPPTTYEMPTLPFDLTLKLSLGSEFEAMDYDKIFKEAQLENNAVDSGFTNTKNDVEKIGEENIDDDKKEGGVESTTDVKDLESESRQSESRKEKVQGCEEKNKTGGNGKKSDESPKNVKRKRKLPMIFKSPFLIKYAHLLEGSEEEKQMMWEFALAPELPLENAELNESRIFFPTEAFNFLCMNDGYKDSSQDITDEHRLNQFIDILKFYMEALEIEMTNQFQLIFIPVYESDQFYIFCINMKGKSLEIIDNIPLQEGVNIEDKYKDYPQKVENPMKKLRTQYAYDLMMHEKNKMKPEIHFLAKKHNHG